MFKKFHKVKYNTHKEALIKQDILNDWIMSDSEQNCLTNLFKNNLISVSVR